MSIKECVLIPKADRKKIKEIGRMQFFLVMTDDAKIDFLIFDAINFF